MSCVCNPARHCTSRVSIRASASEPSRSRTGSSASRVWSKRYAHIVAFERLLTDEGTTVVKVFLHESKDAQRERLQDRIDDLEKRWKFRSGDLDDRAQWDEFQTAYEDVIRQTSTDDAPWYVVPADHSWSRKLCVAEILV